MEGRRNVESSAIEASEKARKKMSPEKKGESERVTVKKS
jgi:hypothetical protein